jgi:hypothetical protein
MKGVPSAIAFVLGSMLLGAEWLGFWPSRVCAASLLLEGLEFGTLGSSGISHNMATGDFGRTHVTCLFDKSFFSTRNGVFYPYISRVDLLGLAMRMGGRDGV